jgi:hypothetical protein
MAKKSTPTNATAFRDLRIERLEENCSTRDILDLLDDAVLEKLLEDSELGDPKNCTHPFAHVEVEDAYVTDSGVEVKVTCYDCGRHSEVKLSSGSFTWEVE